MKTRNRKLGLARETVRSLSPSELDRIAGGLTDSCLCTAAAVCGGGGVTQAAYCHVTFACNSIACGSISCTCF